MKNQKSLLREVGRVLQRLSPRQRVYAILALIAIVAIAVFYNDIDLEALHRRAEGLSAPLVVVLVIMLPLIGIPAFPVQAVAGMRFGAASGMLVVALSIFIQHVAAFAIVKAAPRLFAMRFKRLRKRLPETSHGPLTLFTALLPGVPYFAVLYVLPVVAVPLRTTLLISAPLHALRSTVGVVFGNVSDQLTPARIAGFVGYSIVVLLACSWAYRSIRFRAERTSRRRKSTAVAGASRQLTRT